METVEDIKEACVKINKLGAKNVIIKSGSRVDGDYMVDVLFDGKEFTIQKKAKMKISIIAVQVALSPQQ